MIRLLLLALAMGLAGGAAAQSKTWTADNGNGTFTNPLFYDEFSDPDILRVGDDYYLAGTTMHSVPGLVILHSRDLVNWENIAYCFDRFDFADDAFALRNHREIYGQGVWAPAIRHHNGKFYVFTNVNGKGLQCYTATDIRGPWEHHNMMGRIYDLSVLFDDDGKVYAIHGYGEVKCTELKPDMSGPVEGTERTIIPEGNAVGEGHHIYKIGGTYYLISTDYRPNGRTLCSRAKSIWGPYETVTITADETFGYHAAPLTQVPEGEQYRIGHDGTQFGIPAVDSGATACTNIHQGGIVEDQSGQWWALLMMDFHSIGRTVTLAPITWRDGWPYIGLEGNLGRAPRTWFKPSVWAMMRQGERLSAYNGSSERIEGQKARDNGASFQKDLQKALDNRASEQIGGQKAAAFASSERIGELKACAFQSSERILEQKAGAFGASERIESPLSAAFGSSERSDSRLLAYNGSSAPSDYREAAAFRSSEQSESSLSAVFDPSARVDAPSSAAFPSAGDSIFGPYTRSDDFNGRQLARIWQWNHNPDDRLWSLRKGRLRLQSQPAEQLMWARNTLTQRVIGPQSVATVELYTDGMRDGDVAGLGNINVPCSWIGIVRSGKSSILRMFEQAINDTIDQPIAARRIWLRMVGDYDHDRAHYEYSIDGVNFSQVGREMPLSYQLITFQGSRHALFAFNHKGLRGGFAEFDNFTVDEPQADRSANIPFDRTFRIVNLATGRPAIALDHGLLHDTDSTDRSLQTRFQCIDRGNGRVIIRCQDGRYLMCAGIGMAGDVRLTTDIAKAEEFLWQDYLGHDFMLMSLRNHRYIGKSPTTGSPYSMDYSGADPARQNGAVLHWEE